MEIIQEFTINTSHHYLEKGNFMSNLEKVVKAVTVTATKTLPSGIVTRTTYKNPNGSTTTTTEVEPSKSGAISGAGAGAAVGLLVGGPVGAAVGGAVGGLIGGIFGPSDKSDKSHQNNNE